jgi:hypothetical protein
MKSTLQDLDPSFKKLSSLMADNNKKRKELLDQFSKLYYELSKCETPKKDPLIDAALTVINTASGLIKGLEGEISHWDTDLQKSEATKEFLYNLAEKKQGLLDKAVNVAQIQHIKIKDNKSKRKISGAATAKRYEYITKKAIEVAKNYAQKHPYRLSEINCNHGIKTEINKQILAIFSDPIEYRKANLTDTPDIQTVDKHRIKAFKKLGYQNTTN